MVPPIVTGGMYELGAGSTVKGVHEPSPESSTLYWPAAKVRVVGETEPPPIEQPPLQPQEPYTLSGVPGPPLLVIVNG